jgi:glycosyltransferase involved in cell wall biosynthesis
VSSEPKVRPLIIAEQLRDPLPGGIGVYVRGLISGLVSAGVAPAVITSSGESIAPLVPDLTAADVMMSGLPHRMLVALWDHGLSVPRSMAKRGNIVHATSLVMPGSSKSTPMTVFIHDVSFLRFPDAYPARGLAWHRAALRRAQDRVDLVLVPSTRVADDLQNWGFPADRIAVTGEGSDHREVGLRPSDGGSYFLAVGTLQPRKNLATLVTAYARIRSRLPEPWPLKIVGPEGWGDISITGPTDGVEWLGAVGDSELTDLYAGARVFAYVPLDEGFGLPVVEAQRAGVPVVASTAVPSATAFPLGALTVDATDSDALETALLTAATDEPWRCSAINEGLRVTAEQTWKRCAERHLEAWSRCVS